MQRDQGIPRMPPGLLWPDIPRPRCGVRLVGGPPGCGKSTYVAAHRTPGDLVIDLDEIAAELSGLPIYRAEKSVWLALALEERNRRLRALASEEAKRVAWVIVSAPGLQWGWWRRALRPTVAHSCWVAQSVCEARIRADPRRQHDLARHLTACAEWFVAESSGLQRALARAADDGRA